jgi:DNA-binding HxlR family transcriptional regulator
MLTLCFIKQSLSKALRELEVNGLITRTVVSSVSYELTPYSCTLDKMVNELMKWGDQHRERIIALRKLESISN